MLHQIRQNGDRDSSEQVTAVFGLIFAEAAGVFDTLQIPGK